MRRPLLPALLLIVAAAGSPVTGEPDPGWWRVDYGALVERSLPTHSGESVGELLGRLGGRGLPAVGERPADDLAHRLLDPVLEPYAFVLADALDSLEPAPDPPMIEIGGLWVPGEAEPAWVELLRARRYLVESDGRGRMRVFLPWPDGEARGAPDGTIEIPPERAARDAWAAAWPVLRHVFAAERRRLAKPGAPAPAIDVEARAYRHRPARTAFDLGARPWRTRVDTTAPPADRVPFDLDALASLLARRARIEGARLEADGTIRWFASEAPEPARVLGRPLTLADAATAHRAIFHGGIGEPYMSLDRGRTPWVAAVNFGGRLRDTSIGLVSLLCDVRFKTISLGIDPFSGRDERERLRSAASGFRSHLDRFAADPGSGAVLGQQTRFWFYPDGVEMTLSPEGDVFALRRVRMTAASERVDAAATQPASERDPPWTRDTVAFVNESFEPLARVYPELADLDEAARVLSAFAWLRAAREGGLAVPDLDVLLDVVLPAEPTPRSFPHLLTHDTLPPAGSTSPVDVLGASRVGVALERLQPRNARPLPAARRFQRALGALDPRSPDQAALAKEMEQAEASGVPAEALAALAYRAERLGMHHLVLQSVPAASRAAIDRRRVAGETVRVFSVSIGGIDLGMGAAVERAARRTQRLSGSGAPTARRSPASAAAAPAPPRPSVAVAEPGPGPVMRDHGLPDGADAARHGAHAIRRGAAPGGALRWTLAVYGENGPEARSRRSVRDPEGRAPVFERVEDGRFLTYRFSRADGALAAEVAVAPAPPPDPASGETAPLPEGLATLEVVRPAGGTTLDGSEAPVVRLRLRGPGTRDVAAEVPRAALRRLVLGRDLDASPDRPLPALGDPASLLGGGRGLLVMLERDQARPPWDGPAPFVAGEEDAARLAEALAAWWAPTGRGGPVAVGTRRDASPARWAAAPAAPRKATVVVPPDAFPGWRGTWRARALAALPEGQDDAGRRSAPLVVVVSAESPGVLSERVARLARDPAMKGKALAVAALSSGLRSDLPAEMLAEGNLAAVGVFETEPVGLDAALEKLSAFARELARVPAGVRVDAVPGPFVWFF